MSQQGSSPLMKRERSPQSTDLPKNCSTSTSPCSLALNTLTFCLPIRQQIVDGFIEELKITGKTTVEQHLKLNVQGKNFSLLVNFTRLEDEEDEPVGFVLVFDNLTKLEKMQRMAAWREVARRIAHEIKNPLTPIQLSAQRLRRRYPEILKEKDSVFDQCTNTIITQVDELKTPGQ